MTKDGVYVLDLAAKVDATADYICKVKWGDIEFPPPFGREAYPEVRRVTDGRVGCGMVGGTPRGQGQGLGDSFQTASAPQAVCLAGSSLEKHLICFKSQRAGVGRAVGHQEAFSWAISLLPAAKSSAASCCSTRSV